MFLSVTVFIFADTGLSADEEETGLSWKLSSAGNYGDDSEQSFALVNAEYMLAHTGAELG